MKVIMRWGSALAMGGLAGCVAPPGVLVGPPPSAVVGQAPPQQPFVAVPGPGKTAAAFHQDDVACRTLSSRPLPGPAGSQVTPAPVPDAGEQVPTGAIYLRCMETRNNLIQQLAASPPPLYSYVQAYPVYPGYGYTLGYPWYYGYPWGYGYGFGIGFGFYGGYRGGYYGGYRGFEGYRGGYGGYRGGYEGGGFRGGYEGGGFRGGYEGGGFRGGGFEGGGFHGGGRR